MTKDFYKILDIEVFSTQDEIKCAYRKLARKWHPDVAGNSEDVIVEPKKENTPTLINPMEVAMVSSTLNVIGATSEQKSAIAKNAAADILDNVSDTNTADNSTMESWKLYYLLKKLYTRRVF